MQAPLPVLTIFGLALGASSAVKIWYSYWFGFGLQEDRLGQVRHGLEDDALAVRAEVALRRLGRSRR